MNLKKARAVNSEVARWYIDTIVMGKETATPLYSREEMVEAFRVVDRANKLQPVSESGGRIIYCVCAERIADLVVSFREEAAGWLR